MISESDNQRTIPAKLQPRPGNFYLYQSRRIPFRGGSKRKGPIAV